MQVIIKGRMEGIVPCSRNYTFSPEESVYRGLFTYDIPVDFLIEVEIGNE